MSLNLNNVNGNNMNKTLNNLDLTIKNEKLPVYES